MRNMICTILTVGLFALPVQAKMVVDIGGVGMESTFGPGGLGSFLSIALDNNFPPVDFEDGTTIFVRYDDGTTDAFGTSGSGDAGNGDFILSGLALVSDTSSGGIASGVFSGGSVIMRDESDNVLFSANVDAFTLQEVSVGGDTMLVGGGNYSGATTTVPGADPLPASGGVVSLTFQLSQNISNFSSGFTGLTSMNFVPEPGSLALLGLGAMTVLRRRTA